MGRRPTAPQRGLVLPQTPCWHELTSDASEPSEARRAVIPQTGATPEHAAEAERSCN